MSMLGRHLRAGVATSILVGLLVTVTVFVIAITPRAILRLGTDELRYGFRHEVAARIDLTGAGPVTFAGGADAAALLGPVDDLVARLPSRLPSPLASGAGAGAWVIRTKTVIGSLAGNPTTVLAIKLATEPDWLERVRFVDGAAPVAWTGSGSSDPDGVVDPIDIALARPTAEAMGAGVGDLISTTPAPYRVAGIYEVSDAQDTFWHHAEDLMHPELIRDSGSPLKVQASAFVAPDSVVTLAAEFSEGDLSVWIPIDGDSYRYAQLPTLGEQLREVTATPVDLPNGGTLGFRSEIDGVLDQTRASVTAISALIALGASGFLAVLIAAYALCIQAVIRRRRAVLALATARGAAPRQLRAVMMLEAAAISLPGSAIAIAVASVLLPEAVDVVGWLAPVIVGLVPIVLAAAFTVTSPERHGRDDLGGQWGGTVRWVTEVAVLALAGVAVFLLQRRGLIASSAVAGVDPLLAATPVLLAVGAGLLVLRVYPVPLRAVQRALRGRRAPAASVGSARAVREPAVGLVGTLALVTGLAMTVFTTVMITTVDHGLRQSAHDQVGADIRIMAHDLPATLVSDLTDLPGVGAAVALVSASGIEFDDESGPTEVSVLLADTRALHLVRPDIPVLGQKVDGKLPILVSSDWTDRIDGTELSVVNSPARVQGVIDAQAVPGMTRHWILVDRSAADELGLGGQVPDRVLVGFAHGADPARTVAAVTDRVVAEQPDGFADKVQVDDAQSVLAEIRAAPVTTGLERSLLIVALATLLLTMLVVVLASLTAAASRNRVVGVLRVLGMSPAQIRSLVAWEFSPVAAVAVVVGTGLGLALPFLVTTVLDLRGFFGGNSIPRPALDPVGVAVAIGAFVIAVAGAVVVATAAGRRFAPAGVLKMGDE
jgi:putative ABC transport system permease protein